MAPPLNAGPTPPPPLAPWHPAQPAEEYSSAPSDVSRLSVVGGSRVNAYIAAHTGRAATAGMAHHGILRRLSAATTSGRLSGAGGGGAGAGARAGVGDST